MTPLPTPVKVSLSHLESMGEDGGLRTPQRRSLLGGTGEPLSLDDVYVESSPGGRRQPRFSPCTRASGKVGGGLTVQNTFIHASLPPVTPAPGAPRRFRCRSLHRDFGSDVRPPHGALGASMSYDLDVRAPPLPQALRRYSTADDAKPSSSPGISGSPLFVPQSPGYAQLVPPTPQTPLYTGSAYSQKIAVRAIATDAGRVLRLSDYL